MSETLIIAAINANNIALLESMYPSVTPFSRFIQILNGNGIYKFSYEMIDYFIRIDNYDKVLSKTILNNLIITNDIENLNKIKYLLDKSNIDVHYVIHRFLSMYDVYYDLYHKAVLRLLIDYYKNTINVGIFAGDIIYSFRPKTSYSVNDAILYIMFNFYDKLNELSESVIESLIIRSIMNNASDILLDTFLEYLNILNPSAKLLLQVNRDRVTFKTLKPTDYTSLFDDLDV